MSSRKQILLVILVMSITFFLAYDFFPTKKYITHEKDIIQLESKAFKKFTQAFDTNRSFAYIWGIKEKTLQEQNTIKTLDTNTTKWKIKKEKNKLCINANCYRFLGMYHKQGKNYVVFYANKIPKNHIAALEAKQMLQKPLYIKEITHNHFTIAQSNTTKEWQFDIFDVNATKYKPKDTNETD